MGSSGQPSSVLRSLTEKAEAILLAEALTIKRLGIDNVPLQVAIQKSSDLANEKHEKTLTFLTQADNGQELEQIVQDFANASTSAALELHKAIECVEQNRPFGGSIDVERLMLENLKLAEAIIDYDNMVCAKKSSTD